MKLEPAHIARFEQFLETIGSQTYPEPPTGGHDQISAQTRTQAGRLAVYRSPGAGHVVRAPDEPQPLQRAGKIHAGSRIERSGFRVVDILDITVIVPAGADAYRAFIEQRI